MTVSRNLLMAVAVVLGASGGAFSQDVRPVMTVREDSNPTVSVALTWVFGQGAAVGVKAFSTNREGDAAATLGIDYLFNSGAWRPNVGVAYIDDGLFYDLNLGFTTGEMDFGIGLGPIDSAGETTMSYDDIFESDLDG